MAASSADSSRSAALSAPNQLDTGAADGNRAGSSSESGADVDDAGGGEFKLEVRGGGAEGALCPGAQHADWATLGPLARAAKPLGRRYWEPISLSLLLTVAGNAIFVVCFGTPTCTGRLPIAG